MRVRVLSLRDARIAAGLSGEDVAAALGVSGGSVSLWERGGVVPRGDRHRIVAELSRLYQRADIDDLFEASALVESLRATLSPKAVEVLESMAVTLGLPMSQVVERLSLRGAK